LFTGKVGYLVNNDKSYLLDLVIIWIGNFIGTFLTAQAILHTRVVNISKIAMNITNVKLSDSLISLFILGIFCGLLMYIAVDGYKKTNNPIILFVCVMTFILCGFEHCIADMYYFAISEMINIDTMMMLVVITAGNTLGAILIPLINEMQ
ncbi:MAG: formate/nitrite transporter family protein, partial [Erysipelotrichaceae bacterium]